MDKMNFKGTIRSIQPRIRLMRSFDESSHSYLGYVIALSGWLMTETETHAPDNSGLEPAESAILFSIAIGPAAQAKHQFRAGDQISGTCVPVVDAQLETADYNKVSRLKKIAAAPDSVQQPPPWLTLLPDLETYRQRGPRRLSSITYKNKCNTCIWGCQMPVEIIIDHWNPGPRHYRFETFCYGPLSCRLYKAGPNRKVEGRHGMVYIEEDWVDQELTGHRETDE
ncbi:MAG: hypothetical protein SCM11_04450 [Bacillota bacterium]|nr:hypothetical protein [Bacillota bacterium]